MNIVFYYSDCGEGPTSGGTWEMVFLYADWLKCAGNEVAIYSPREFVRDKTCSGVPLINSLGIANFHRAVSRNDVFICCTGAGEYVDLNQITCKKILWSHCWDIYSKREDFDAVVALSPKHARHLKTEYWCYNGYDSWWGLF